VIAAALALVDREGIEALTMRRLAADLGVEAMSLYHWFPSKASILDGVIEAIIRELDSLPLPPDGPPAEILIDMGRSYRQALLAHPNMFAVVAARPLTTLEGILIIERALEALRRSGFSPVQAISSVRTLAAYVLGAVAVQLAQLDSGWPDDDPGHSRELPTFPLASLPTAEYPRIHEVAQAFIEQRWTADDLFERGLEAVVTGLVAQATEQQWRLDGDQQLAC
jgi:AcrR family transcriptional regulator